MVFFLICLVSLNFYMAEEQRKSIPDKIYYPDDLFHISIADSFRNEKTFNLQYLIIGDSTEKAEIVLPTYPTIPQNSKGPMYYITLGVFYQIFSTGQEDLYEHASFFNNILASIFLILFFFFVKKVSNTKIACGSSLLVSLVPGFVSISHIVNIDPLVIVFIISSLFFIEKKKLCYILFGVFSGLASLTHPIANPLIISYSVFLLLKKEFKGFLLTMSTWILVLSPWFVRNYTIFSDIGPGLQIPFSSKISEIIASIIPSKDSPIGIDQANRINSTEFGFLELIYNATHVSGYLGNMELLIVFILIFSGAVFFNLNNKKKKFRYIVTSFGTFITSYLLVKIFLIKQNDKNVWTYPGEVAKTTELILDVPHIIELIILFIIIPISIFLIFKKKKHLFVENINRTYLFIIIYCIFQLFAMYIFSNNSRWDEIPSRFVFLQTLLLIPIALIGLEKIMKASFSTIKFKQKIIFSIVIMLIFSPMIINMVEANNLHKEFKGEIRNDSRDLIDNEIISRTSPEDVIASSNPSETWLQTDRFSVSLPYLINDKEEFEDYIEYFNIAYFVYYESQDTPSLEQIKQITSREYDYNVEQIGNGYIVQVQSFMNSSINNPEMYIAKMLAHENNKEYEIAKTILNELRNYDKELKIEKRICKGFIQFELYEESIYKCKKIFEKDNTNISILINLFVAYNEMNQIEERDNILNQILELINRETDDGDIDSLSEMMDYTILDNVTKNKYLLIKAHAFEMIEQYDEARDIYYELLKNDRFNPILYIKLGEYYEAKNNIRLAIHNYETSLKIDYNNEYVLEKIEKLKDQ